MLNEGDHDELRELLGAYALNALDWEERAAVEHHLAHCRDCRDEVAVHAESLRALTPSAPAPRSAWERIEAEIQSDPQLREADEAHAAEAGVPRIASARSGRWIAGAAAVAAAVALTLVVSDSGGPGRSSLQAQVVPASDRGTVSGQVRLFDPNTPAGRIMLDLSDLPQSPAGHHYQVWVLRADGGGAMEAIGAFSVDGSTARIELPLPGPGDYAAVDVSVEEDGGPADHSGLSVAGATLSEAAP